MKRSKLKIALAATLLLALAVPVVASAATITMAFEGGTLNLRSGPGRNYSIKDVLDDGDYVRVISYGEIWSKVRTDDGVTGYVKNLYIDDGDYDYAAGIEYFDHHSVYTTANVNMRSGASTSTAVIRVLPKGTKVMALGENENFYLVQTEDGTQGFVYQTYLSRKKPAATNDWDWEYTDTKTVTASWVNMRAGGGMSYDVVRVLRYGTEVDVLYTGNYWTKVQYGSTEGWIKNTYLR